jgi:hypothetical protein
LLLEEPGDGAAIVVPQRPDLNLAGSVFVESVR